MQNEISEKSFVAEITVRRIQRRMEPQAQPRQNYGEDKNSRRINDDLKLVIRSSTLEGLKKKIAAHTNLLDEEDIA